ncbi:MAG: hypothetical protein ACFE7R_02580 [Candidatus Hodarchaeota archaeon]
MQIILDMAVYSNIAATVLSVIVSLYLVRLWKRQETRLYTDLPLVFGVSFMAQAVNTFMLAFSTMGLIEVTMEVFRVRATLIALALIPLSLVLLSIWLPRLQSRYGQILGVLTVYMVSVALLGPTEEFIMSLSIPIILVILVGLIVTFTVTWKTGRLKEVRSELMVVSIILMFISQMAKVPLTAMGLVILPDLITAISTIMAAIAITNPWYRKTESPPKETELTAISY